MNPFKFLLVAALILSSLTDILRQLSLGPISSLGVMTLFFAATTWLLVFARLKMPKVVLVTSCLLLFVVSALLSWLWYFRTLPPVSAIQNLSVYLGFVGFTVLSIVQSNRTFDVPEYISKVLPRAIKLSVMIYGSSILIGGPGTNIIMGSRSFALFSIIGFSWFLAALRYRLPGAFKWTIIITVVVAFSFSRTGLVVGLLLFPLSQISLGTLKGWLRFGLTIGMIITVSLLAFTYVEPIRSRFSDAGDNATVGGIRINTSGRNAAWPVAYTSALESPWVGKGPGSVGSVLVKRVGEAFAHPHNDYLRIFHDFGIVGMTLWLVGYWRLAVRIVKNWQWSERNDRENAHIHLASFLSLVGISLAMIFDNVVVYLFCMAPLGILAGASIGNTSRRKKVIKSSRNFAIASGNFQKMAVEK